MVDDDVEIPAVDVVLPDELRLKGLLDCRLQPLALADEFAAYVDVAIVHTHGAAGDQAAFDQQMRIVAHDLTVLAGTGLGLVGIDHEVMRPARRFLRHERPFQSGWKADAAAATLARGLAFVDQTLAAFGENILGAVPGAAGAGCIELPAVMAVEILEDAVLIGEHFISLSPHRSADRSRCSGRRPAPSSADRSAALASESCRSLSR